MPLGDCHLFRNRLDWSGNRKDRENILGRQCRRDQSQHGQDLDTKPLGFARQRMPAAGLAQETVRLEGLETRAGLGGNGSIEGWAPQRKILTPDLTSLAFSGHPSAHNVSRRAGPFRPGNRQAPRLERCRHMVIHIVSAPIGCLKNETKYSLLDIHCQAYSYGFDKYYSG